MAKVKLVVNDSRGRFKLNHGHINAQGVVLIRFILYATTAVPHCTIVIFRVNYDPKLFDIVVLYGGATSHKF